VKVHLWSEDKRSREGLRKLVRRLLPGLEVEFFPPTFDELRGGHAYASTSPRQHRVRREFQAYLARVLAQGDAVVFHEDGDTTWQNHKESRVRRRMEDLKVRVLQQAAGPPRTPGSSKRELDDSLFDERFVPCVPHYSLEAWTYQADARAIALCREHFSGKDVGKFEGWARDRAALDEVEMPKEATCLQDRFNDDLADHVPIGAVVARNKSLWRFVKAIKASALAPRVAVNART